MLVNRIIKATATKDISALIELDIETDGAKFLKLPIYPEITLKYLNDVQTLTQKIIETRIYPYREDYNITFNATADVSD